MTNNKFIVILFFILISCLSSKNQKASRNTCCEIGSNSLYPRLETSKLLLSTIDSLIPIKEGAVGNGYFIKDDCHMGGFFVYDLVDTLNKETNYRECVKFIEGHVYHFAPRRINESYSSIAVLKGGKVKIFKAINCLGKGDTLEETLKYISDLYQTPGREQITNRVKNYRKYGVYTRVDEQTQFRCR